MSPVARGIGSCRAAGAQSLGGAATLLVGAGVARAGRRGRTRNGQAPMASMADRGPTPSWDTTDAGPAVRSPPAPASGPALVPGQLNRVVWMCWTGHNPIPPHLRLCMRTVERNSGLPVVLVTPENVLQYVPDPHPAYSYLHLQHRADYLRCCLLHRYGGVYLDMDTICLRNLAELYDLLDTYDAVGYDGSEWGELIGISDMGPFRPGTKLTELWYNVLHGKMAQQMADMEKAQTDTFYWQEILRDIFVPVSMMQRERVSQGMRALNPEKEDLWSMQTVQERLGNLDDAHVLILNNSKYGQELSPLTEEQILGGPAVLSQLLRSALGLKLG